MSKEFVKPFKGGFTLTCSMHSSLSAVHCEEKYISFKNVEEDSNLSDLHATMIAFSEKENNISNDSKKARNSVVLSIVYGVL
jgi:hypothetical protein